MQKEFDVSESSLIKVDKCAHRRRGRRPGQYSQEKYKMQKKKMGGKKGEEGGQEGSEKEGECHSKMTLSKINCAKFWLVNF